MCPLRGKTRRGGRPRPSCPWRASLACPGRGRPGLRDLTWGIRASSLVYRANSIGKLRRDLKHHTAAGAVTVTEVATAERCPIQIPNLIGDPRVAWVLALPVWYRTMSALRRCDCFGPRRLKLPEVLQQMQRPSRLPCSYHPPRKRC